MPKKQDQGEHRRPSCNLREQRRQRVPPGGATGGDRPARGRRRHVRILRDLRQAQRERRYNVSDSVHPGQATSRDEPRPPQEGFRAVLRHVAEKVPEKQKDEGHRGGVRCGDAVRTETERAQRPDVH